ncbi:phosphomethylpyrimidine synthase ThiC [Candidatus Micrarchaeota archaeon CG11_big_fil_rev_8_21_14_0_20_47_5]|nr:MAG: phosphomethylpyrimidine synthase [Candidatus Micrarchaeota archaeon CG1_02_47_40]PIN83839.1 MAG: phosphomethylpyrimidine synthase ThiC [Candidatus Micrarchaeota archaeon CG11_big_fil_rev_8_21_14_0_20_47_5]QBM01417.1 phosphomethylpyrimidine synthase [uncultured archaeon]
MDLREIAKKEKISVQKLECELKAGRAVLLCHNKKPSCILSNLCTTKINTNLGISAQNGLAQEINKLEIAQYYGTDTVMDLSTKNTLYTLRTFLKNSSVPVGSVPIYECFPSPSEEDFLHSIEKHIKAGASFLTIHAAFKRSAIPLAAKRITKIVSRGGGILAEYMVRNKCENPLYANFDNILDLLEGTDCAISLGDALRPGCIADANDSAQLSELKTQGELVLRSRERKVPVFCEGPGHMPLNTIVENVKLQKKWCHKAPYYVLGPLVSDTALGYDHISSAIGATVAAAAGVEFLCAVTPSEHYRLPTLEDIKEGVIAYKIAAHSADICKLKGASKRDLELSRARYALDWRTQEKLSITRKKVETCDNTPCSMCKELCPMRRCQTLFKGAKK